MVQRVPDISFPGATGPLQADLYRPKGIMGPLPAVPMMHGGGFYYGDEDVLRSAAEIIAERCKVVAFAFDYRKLATSDADRDCSDVMAAYDDSRAAIRFAQDTVTNHWSNGQVVFAGGSAGAVCGAMGAADNADGVLAYVCFSASLEDDENTTGLCPYLDHITANSAPILLVTDDNDPITPDHSERIVAAYVAAGIGDRAQQEDVAGSDHAFGIFLANPDVQTVVCDYITAAFA